MKNILFGFAIAAITLATCKNADNNPVENQKINKDTGLVKPQSDTVTTPSVADVKNLVSIKEIVSIYIQLKNVFRVR